jgi:hypothetical protein
LRRQAGEFVVEWPVSLPDWGFWVIEMVSAGCYPSCDVTTPLYEAPELFHQCKYTKKVDIFAFAIVLYEILGGAMD